MICKLCSNSLSASCGRQVDEEVRKLLLDSLLSEFVDSLNDEDEVCSDCFSCFEELRTHYAELQKIQEAIQKVTVYLNARLSTKANLTAHTYGTRSRGRGATSSEWSESLDENSSTNIDNQSLLLKFTSSSATSNKKRKVEVGCEPPVEIKLKQEPEDAYDMIEDSTEFCQMDADVGGTSSADEEVASVKEEPETEMSDVDSMMLDDTTQFILNQMLSSDLDSDSDSDFEIRKRKTTRAGKKNQVLKSMSADAVTSNKPCRKPKQRGTHASTLQECECELCEPKKIFPSIVSLSKHYEMDHRDTERVFMCEKFGCDEKLLTYDFLEIHKKSHYSYEWRAMTGAPMYHRAYCNICQLSSYFPAELRNHELEKHSGILKYACSTCGAKYFSKDILDAHTLAHAEMEQLECPLCPNEWKFKYPDTQSFESHLIRMHSFPRDYPKYGSFQKYRIRKITRGSNTKCEKCGKVYGNKKRAHKCLGNAKFECDLCHRQFDQKAVLVSHAAVYHEGEKNKSQWNPNLVCHKCGKQFATTLMYKRHLNCHNLETRLEFYCGECEDRYATESLLSTHVKNRHHPDTKLVRLSHVIICEVCGKFYNNILMVRKHEREEHPNLFVFACNKCDAKFSKSEYLETHLKAHEAVGPYVCSLCPKIFCSTGEELEAHLKKAHTEGAGKTCPTCGEKLASAIELARHRSVKHGEPMPLQCEFCGKGNCRPTDFKRHVEKCKLSEEMRRKKALEDRKQCEICKNWYASSSSLGSHIRAVHERATVRVCEICGKSLNSGKTAMEDHMKIHRQEKNFACDFCDKRFVRAYALRVHRYTHTGEKPLACYICDKRFNQHSPLKKHIETHKKDGSWFPKPPKPNSMGPDESSSFNNFQ